MASNGNFSTMNPLHKTSTNVQYSNGNLTFSPNSSWSTTTFTRNNMVIPKDKKIYMEVHCDNQSGDYHMFGVSAIHALPLSAQSGGTGTVMIYNGSTRINGTRTDNVVTNPSQGDIVGIAIDGSNNKVWFAVNNTWQLSGDPSNGTNELGTVTTNDTVGFDITFAFNQNSASILTANFGQDSTFGGQKTAGGNEDANGFGDFYYAPPTNFLSLCSANLSISDDIDPAQTDDDFVGGKHFNVLTYTGTGSSRTISGLGMQPDLIWAKTRSTSSRHYLVDSSRGFTKYLHPEDTFTEGTSSDGVTSANSDGFVIGGGLDYVNYSSRTFVAWCWRANGGTTASNSNGETTSTVQANQDAGFSIVEYTGTLTSSGTKTIGHGLSKAPEFIIIKNPNKAGRWFVQHEGLTSWNYYLSLNTNGSQTNASGNGSMSDPTNTVFSTNWTEGSNEYPYNHIAYCWHSVEGYSKFGKFEGNSNTDGPFIYTGFRPRLVFCKAIDASENWQVRDTARSTFNANSQVRIYWNSSAAEGSASTASPIDFLSQGFKVRGSNSEINTNTIVYGAWGDVPAKYNNSF